MFETLESRRLLSSSLVNGLLTVNGTAGNDTISLSVSGSNIQVSQTGSVTKNFATSSVQKILINALGGNDKVTVANAITKPTTINGSSGNDSLTSGGGNDVINGGAGDDKMHGGSGKDALVGGAGNDALDGGSGNDFLSGQAGSDTIDYSSRSSKITATIAVDDTTAIPAGSGGQSGENDTYLGCEILTGGSVGDTLEITGAGAPEEAGLNFPSLQIFGGGGNDSLNARSASAGFETAPVSLHGGSGNDTIYFNSTLAANIYGDSGNDTIKKFDDDAVFKSIDGGSGTDLLSESGLLNHTITIPTNVENLNVSGFTGSGLLTVTGNDLSNHIVASLQSTKLTLDAKGGNDVIDCSGTQNFGVTVMGGSGDDVITGTAHSDSLVGGTGHDNIKAGAGNDILIGNDGQKDSLDGGAGFDTAKRDLGIDTVFNVEVFI